MWISKAKRELGESMGCFHCARACIPFLLARENIEQWKSPFQPTFCVGIGREGGNREEQRGEKKRDPVHLKALALEAWLREVRERACFPGDFQLRFADAAMHHIPLFR